MIALAFIFLNFVRQIFFKVKERGGVKVRAHVMCKAKFSCAIAIFKGKNNGRSLLVGCGVLGGSSC